MASKSRKQNYYEGISKPKYVKLTGGYIVTIVKNNDQTQKWFRTEEEANKFVEEYKCQKTQ